MLNILFLDDQEIRYEALMNKPNQLKKLLRVNDEINLVWVKTLNEFIAAFPQHHWDLITMDHDLGDFHIIDGELVEKDGKDVAHWLVKLNPDLSRTYINIHSMNPDPAEDMRIILAPIIQASKADFRRIMSL